MAYDEGLAHRLRAILADRPGITEKKMFGGLSFLLNGNLACGVIGEELIIRVGQDGHADAMAEPHVRVFDFSGKPMAGWVVVTPPGFEEDADLQAWVERGVGFAGTLPTK